MLGGFQRVLRHGAETEIAGKTHVAGESFLRGDTAVCTADLVYNCLGAETAYPAAMVPLPHAHDVRRRAFLGHAAALALGELHLHLRRRRPLRLRRGDRHLSRCSSFGKWENSSSRIGERRKKGNGKRKSYQVKRKNDLDLENGRFNVIGYLW